MTILDMILAVPILWLVFRGWKKGLVREAATLAGVVAGIWAAVHLSQLVSSLLGLTGESAILIAFFITFVGAMVLVYLLGRSIEGVMKVAKISVFNKISGAILGMVKALCILAVILNGVVMLDRSEQLVTPETKQRSLLFTPVNKTGNLLIASLRDFIDEHRGMADKIIGKAKEGK